MFPQRLALLAIVALTFLCSFNSVNAKEFPHDLIVGSRVWGDHLLQKVHVQVDYSWFRIVKDTKTFTGDGVSNITQIQILDQKRDGTNVTPTIMNGGPGNSWVTISFRSKRSQTIDYIVEIYGKR